VQFGVMSLPKSSAACHPQRTLSAWYELKTFAHADIVDDACRQWNSVYRAVRIFIDNAERLSGTGDAWPRRRSGPRPRRRSGSRSGRWSGRCSRTRSCGGGWGRCGCGSCRRSRRRRACRNPESINLVVISYVDAPTSDNAAVPLTRAGHHITSGVNHGAGVAVVTM